MTTTAVPTIRDTIVGTLNGNGYASYATLPVVDQLVAALVDREVAMNSDAGVGQSDQPVTDEINRRLSVAEPTDEGVGTKSQRISRLEYEVEQLTQFARSNGYRL